MAEQVDMSNYNYFDVEDFSIDSFFRSLELQSRFAPNDLEFSFPADLDGVPISSVSFLDSSPLKSSTADSRLSAAEDIPQCSSRETEGAAETSVAGLNDDDDNAAAVDVFFRSLQLRSCLLHTPDKTTHNSSSQDKANTSGNAGDLVMPTASNVQVKTDEKLTDDNDTDVATVHGSHGSALLKKVVTKSDRVSSACCSYSQPKNHQATKLSLSSTVVEQLETPITLASTHAECTLYSSASCSRSDETSSLADQTSGCRRLLHSKEYSEIAETEDNCERSAVKAGKMSCDVCGVTLRDKYSYVRHLLTPLHRRRAQGYCTGTPCNPSHADDIARLLSRHEPVQCRICRFHGDAPSQLLYHLTSSSHFARAKRKLLHCVPCRFVGTCEDIITHVKSNSHASLVSRSNQPSVIAACRRSRCHGQAIRSQAKQANSCDVCDAKFPSASSLEIHARRRHTGQRPFRCDVCSKAYCDNSTLTLHCKTARHTTKCALVQGRLS